MVALLCARREKTCVFRNRKQVYKIPNIRYNLFIGKNILRSAYHDHTGKYRGMLSKI